MSWQTPDGDPPPEPAAQPPTAAPEPDAETARFPVAETPASEPLAGPETAAPLEPETAPAASDAPPPAGIISAAPVGWTPPPGDPSTVPQTDGPVVPWSAPAAPAAATAVGAASEGVVIARVFPRVVAYFVDVLILGAVGLLVSIPLGLYNRDRDQALAFGVGAALVVVDLIYFVALWTSSLQATLGMRLLRLRVLNAATAGSLPFNDALLRWLGLTGAIAIIGLVPGIDRYVGLIGAIWLIVLLVTTGSDRLRQGLHDKWARSVVVQPAPGGSGLAFATCLVLVLVFGILLPVAGIALYGDRIRDILVEIGNSV
jgi:uncharacterized RDD family membrane protein YckC